MSIAHDLLAGLDPEQTEVAQTLRGPVCIVAGAGTGKTRAITHRIAYGVATGVYSPTEVLAVTFTNRAAAQMRGRLQQLGSHGVQARTFHAAALRQARYFWPRVYGGDLPELTASKIPLITEAARRCGIQTDRAVLRDLAAEIEWAKVSNVRPREYARRSAAARRSVGDLAVGVVGNVFAAYEEIKRDRGRIDMEDILLVTAAILAEDERVAAEVRRQYRWFVVDEYQDVNPLQAKLLDLWLGGRDDLCVVGDPRQTIYSFAGASPELLNDFTKRYRDATRHELVRNYRSTPQVVAAANAVFSKSSMESGVQLQSQQQPGDPVSYLGYPDEPAEAAGVANEIASLHKRGIPYREMAILFRINAQSEAFEEALANQSIPYVLRGVERFFERSEVRQAVTLLRGAARSAEPSGHLGSDVEAVLSSIGYSKEPPGGTGAVRDRWESLHALSSMADDMAEADPDAGLPEFVDDLGRRASTAQAPAAEGVTLSTLHSAKGLEWDGVFCVGMHEGMMPSIHAVTGEAIAEERRLFYVGLTRARSSLMISWSATRHPGGRGNRKPTRFLDPLLPAGNPARQTDKPRRGRKVARCRVCNETLATGEDRKRGRCADCPSTYDEALYEELRSWRGAQAEQQKVPAYVVFTDATLQSVAEMKPKDNAALARVPGVGAVKLERYGADVIAMCCDHSLA